MVAVVTDIKYRMAVPLIRSLAGSGWQVIAAEYSDVPERECLGFASRHCWKREHMSRPNPVNWLLELPQRLGLSAPPVIIPVGAFTITQLSRSRKQWCFQQSAEGPTPFIRRIHKAQRKRCTVPFRADPALPLCYKAV